MVVGAKVFELTEDLLWFVCGLYVGILTSSLKWTYTTQYQFSLIGNLLLTKHFLILVTLDGYHQHQYQFNLVLQELLPLVSHVRAVLFESLTLSTIRS